MPYFGQGVIQHIWKTTNCQELNEKRIINVKPALDSANIIIFTFSLWNLGIPAPLKTFLDYVV